MTREEREQLFETLYEDMEELQDENERLKKALQHPDFIADVDGTIAEVLKKRRTGHWIKHDGYWECSECHAERAYCDEHCPYCGIKMESEE